ncbi:RNA polymerase sigma-70 factor, ECF subfamily [Amphibacillus marinus]|uniref:RNA polymerase sigma-70 factor, ECF subfamily n=1 Tax=Amphibacillus marinus TaxID=872970 RepID=A0A1H8NBQ9_9BACI|nr:sigma-70 family RNA polymerase sigma factor [Amphibacillus marinus]SEO26986.1 RNA polymerase sigma-70 factor, ECF subfamily [Amphibacillus marinus]
MSESGLTLSEQFISTELDWLEEVINQHGQMVQRITYTYVKDHATAEDLTQEIFLKVYRKIDSFHFDSSFKTWIYRIAINHCKDYLKSWHYRHVLVNEYKVMHTQGSVANSVSLQAGETAQNEQLVNAVLALPIRYREVIFLFYYEDLSIKMIAKITKSKEGTIKARLNRARKILRKQLEQEGYHERSIEQS